VKIFLFSHFPKANSSRSWSYFKVNRAEKWSKSKVNINDRFVNGLGINKLKTGVKLGQKERLSIPEFGRKERMKVRISRLHFVSDWNWSL